MKTQTILKWALVLGIAIVLNLFFNYAIAWAYPEPKWEDFCKQEQVVIQPKNQTECTDKGGQWTETPMVKGDAQPMAIDAVTGRPVPVTGYCDLNFTCSQKFNDESKVYGRNVFVALVVLGVISIGVSFALVATVAVSLGLSLGGVLSLVIASMRYWSYMEGYLRVVVLGLALAALIWLGVKKIKE